MLVYIQCAQGTTWCIPGFLAGNGMLFCMFWRTTFLESGSIALPFIKTLLIQIHPFWACTADACKLDREELSIVVYRPLILTTTLPGLQQGKQPQVCMSHTCTVCWRCSLYSWMDNVSSFWLVRSYLTAILTFILAYHSHNAKPMLVACLSLQACWLWYY